MDSLESLLNLIRGIGSMSVGGLGDIEIEDETEPRCLYIKIEVLI